MNPALTELVANLTDRRDQVEEWLAAEFAKQRLPFYCSVDMRRCAHKIAPVDTNLFPAGFNNLAPVHRRHATKLAQRVLSDIYPGVRTVALIAENHTRNRFYADHLLVLHDILTGAGYEVKVAFLEGDPALLAGHHQKIAVSTLTRTGDILSCDGVEPDLVLLNHDQTAGISAILTDVAQPVMPPPAAGWAHRRKSSHFFQYERVTSRFAREFGCDSWLLEAYFNVCNRVDISRNIGLGCLAHAIEETLADIQSNYVRLGCADKPFVALKADAGTYGMGVVMVEDTRRLNRRQRQSLSVIKDGISVTDILIQEGVPTTDRVESLVAEPVYYMVGAEIAGGFWRLNQSKSARSNLNSRGMLFWPMADGSRPRGQRAYALEVVVRLALLATTRELAGDLARSDTKG